MVYYDDGSGVWYGDKTAEPYAPCGMMTTSFFI